MIDKFLPMVLEAEEEGTVSPILIHDKVTFVYIKHNNLYCILVCGEREGTCTLWVCMYMCIRGWLGTEQVRNTEVYRTLTICNYYGAVHISISITALCPVNIECSNLQLPRDSSVAVLQTQRLIPEGRSFEKRPCDELPELHSNFAWL